MQAFIAPSDLRTTVPSSREAVTLATSATATSAASGLGRGLDAPRCLVAGAVGAAALASRGRRRPCRHAEGEQVVTPWEVEAGEGGVDYVTWRVFCRSGVCDCLCFQSE